MQGRLSMQVQGVAEMGLGAVADRTRLALFLARRGLSAGAERVLGLPMLPGRFTAPIPDRLLIAPQDLRTADPTRAAEIYSGRYAFAGRIADGLGRSPFSIEPPSEAWAEALHGFSWLRHMRAADSALARAHARVLVEEWLTLGGGRHPAAWQPDVIGRRLISWLCQSPLILDGADRAFYRRFLRGIMRQVHLLRRRLRSAQPGIPRLTAVMALAFAGLCLSGQARLLRFASHRLGEEIALQILPDGGHIGRNPGALVTLLLDFLPLRQAYAAQNTEPPVELLNAIDRMMPMIRFFRLGDGTFALFNGMGATPVDAVATVLSYDDARGTPVMNAPHSGYQRLDGGSTALVMDTGTPPPPGFSHEAGAGCLSFELSAGDHRLITNCGMPLSGRDSLRTVARSTPAHSTLTVGDTSSCRFVASPRLRRLFGAPIVAGPSTVPVERTEDSSGVMIRAAHDGYASRFGLVHGRTIRLSAAGGRLEGVDHLTVDHAHTRQAEDDVPFAIRFHLHPGVRASRVQDGRGVMLVLPNRETWLFGSRDLPVSIEESIFLAGSDGSRRTEQIVLHGRARSNPEVRWVLARSTVRGESRHSRTEPADELPL